MIKNRKLFAHQLSYYTFKFRPSFYEDIHRGTYQYQQEEGAPASITPSYTTSEYGPRHLRERLPVDWFRTGFRQKSGLTMMFTP